MTPSFAQQLLKSEFTFRLGFFLDSSQRQDGTRAAAFSREKFSSTRSARRREHSSRIRRTRDLTSSVGGRPESCGTVHASACAVPFY